MPGRSGVAGGTLSTVGGGSASLEAAAADGGFGAGGEIRPVEPIPEWPVAGASAGAPSDPACSVEGPVGPSRAGSDLGSCRAAASAAGRAEEDGGDTSESVEEAACGGGGGCGGVGGCCFLGAFGEGFVLPERGGSA